MDHPDSPYIRGIGFLFVRYLVNPEKLMDWFVPYFEDETEIQIDELDSEPQTIAKLARMLLTKHEYYNTHLPRLTHKHKTAVEQALKEYDEANPGSASLLEVSRSRSGGGAQPGPAENDRSGRREHEDRRDVERSRERDRDDRRSQSSYSRGSDDRDRGYDRRDDRRVCYKAPICLISQQRPNGQ